MRLEGELVFTYKSRKTAGDVAGLIEMDNLIAPKTLRIRTGAKDADVVTRLASEKASTFFATVDDLFFSERLITELLET